MSDRVKRLLTTITDDFSSEDIAFIEGLDYPRKVSINNLALVEGQEGKYDSTEVDDLDELEKLFKRLPQRCRVSIVGLTGTLILESRESC